MKKKRTNLEINVKDHLK